MKKDYMELMKLTLSVFCEMYELSVIQCCKEERDRGGQYDKCKVS